MEVGQLEILESCRQLSAKNKFNKIELDYGQYSSKYWKLKIIGGLSVESGIQLMFEQ